MVATISWDDAVCNGPNMNYDTTPHINRKTHQSEKQSKNINPMFSIKIGNYLKDIITEKFSKLRFVCQILLFIKIMEYFLKRKEHQNLDY